ncbi:MAG: HAD hydrolase-like protein [Candidatus Sedimenticola sp. PURPLELP]
MYSKDRLLILDADGTTIDAFSAIEQTFSALNMKIGDLERFQKRRHIFKYLGGLKEFPTNLSRQLGKQKRSKLIQTLTEVYREEASLYPATETWMEQLFATDRLRVGFVTRNITHKPLDTLKVLLMRHGVDTGRFDFLVHVELNQDKTSAFRKLREAHSVNPARSYACGDEKKDYYAAQLTGMHPFMVSYGFEDFERLTYKIGVPGELISKTPEELHQRIIHAFTD